MSKSENYELSDSQIKGGLKKALLGSIELAGYAKDILERNGNASLSFGLYFFAIEEYGKYEILRECLLDSVKRHLVSKDVFDTKKSKVNFKKALNALPKEIHEKLPIRLSSDSQSEMDCFYLNWDHENEKWKVPPKIDSSQLLESITAFERHASMKLDTEYDSQSSVKPL
ncbi:MAG: hypothetical protein HKM23_03465 [Nitrosopumilus sp.]|nr:hypothetical protein [Nitrosopumilus sp.]NNL58938.1 hypothetical protein [Nitrosopumilus sp.]